MTQISETILAQLGGTIFLAMTGARELTTRGPDLRMKLSPRLTLQGINLVTITLDRTTDTYTVQFAKYRNLTVVAVAEVNMVHADQLRNVFETHTGMRTSL